MSSLPKIVAVDTVAKSRLFRIESVHLCFSNNEQRHFERVQGGVSGSVMVVPMLDDETVLLIREYSVGVENYTLGFVKGAISPGETALETAHRELQEEAGYAADKLESITTFFAAPGYLAASMQLIVAYDLHHSLLPGDEPEPLEVVPWSLHQVDQLLQHDEFIDARSIAALLWVERRWRGKSTR